MEKTTEQRAAICFCWKAGFNATKIFEMIHKIYGKSAVHRATMFHVGTMRFQKGESRFVTSREAEDR